MVKVKFSIVLMLLMGSFTTFGQEVKLSDKEKDRKSDLDELDRTRNPSIESATRFSGFGTIHFVEGDSAKGEIAFIDAFRIAVNGKKYSPKSVESFSLYDYRDAKTRSFIVLEYNDKRSGINDFVFFEMLFEFESFALLEKIDPAEEFTYYITPGNPATTTGTGPGAPSGGGTKAVYERIYVFDGDGNTEPYLQTRHLDPEPLLGKERKTKIISSKLLFSHLEPQLKELKKFAKENNLSFEEREDFLKIMQYYQKLVK